TTRARRRHRTRSIGSRSRASRRRAGGSSLIFDHRPAVAPRPSPSPAHYLVARDHRLPAFRHVHLLMNVFHPDVLVSARSLALKSEQALLIGGWSAIPFLEFRWRRVVGDHATKGVPQSRPLSLSGRESRLKSQCCVGQPLPHFS